MSRRSPRHGRCGRPRHAGTGAVTPAVWGRHRRRDASAATAGTPVRPDDAGTPVPSTSTCHPGRHTGVWSHTGVPTAVRPPQHRYGRPRHAATGPPHRRSGADTGSLTAVRPPQHRCGRPDTPPRGATPAAWNRHRRPDGGAATTTPVRPPRHAASGRHTSGQEPTPAPQRRCEHHNTGTAGHDTLPQGRHTSGQELSHRRPDGGAATTTPVRPASTRASGPPHRRSGALTPAPRRRCRHNNTGTAGPDTPPGPPHRRSGTDTGAPTAVSPPQRRCSQTAGTRPLTTASASRRRCGHHNTGAASLGHAASGPPHRRSGGSHRRPDGGAAAGTPVLPTSTCHPGRHTGVLELTPAPRRRCGHHNTGAAGPATPPRRRHTSGLEPTSAPTAVPPPQHRYGRPRHAAPGPPHRPSGTDTGAPTAVPPPQHRYGRPRHAAPGPPHQRSGAHTGAPTAVRPPQRRCRQPTAGTRPRTTAPASRRRCGHHNTGTAGPTPPGAAAPAV